jgi:hypothetical protein
MIEAPESRGNIARFVRELSIDAHTAEDGGRAIKSQGKCPIKKTRVAQKVVSLRNTKST